MEIIVGKMFKMEVWETLLTSMRIGEVAEFWCDSIHTGLYPIVSKGMRLIAEGKDPLEGQRHTCGMGNLFDYHSMGYKDLDELMREPQPLIFIMELIQVGDPFSYHRDSWAMDKDEKLAAVPALHSEGNALVKQRRFRAAARKYQEAVILLRNVQAKEKPGEEDYVKLDKLITPLVLNYCQCMLELKEYYEVLEHTTELIERKKGNVKAYYKRAKAHAAVWNEKEARQDFLMVATLDISLAPLVQREIKLLKERMREKYSEEKLSYWGILGDKGGHKNSDREEEEEEEEKEQELEEEEEKEVDKAKEELESTVTQREEVEQMVARDEKVKSRMEVPSKVGRPNQNTETGREQPQGSSGNGAAVPVGKGREEMLRLVPLLHNEGNYLMKETRYREASQKFKEAIDYVKFIQSKVSHLEFQYSSLDGERPKILYSCLWGRRSKDQNILNIMDYLFIGRGLYLCQIIVCTISIKSAVVNVIQKYNKNMIMFISQNSEIQITGVHV
ncbi:AIPL1 protein, partial [Amia calva]|nr:AIPL1 protein [Amia calva]